MKDMLIGAILLMLAGITNAAPVVYTNEALYLSDLVSLGYSTVSESFEDGAVWADSRNSISSPGSTPSVTSQGIMWTSNYNQNNLATGGVGGSAPDGSFAIYSLPHGLTTDSGLYCDSAEDPDIPVECFQNDGLKIQSETGDSLYAFGGRFDSNTGTPKITFLLDGVDINGNNTDNIDNVQREGDLADNWDFVGVIDTDGFFSAELRELKGKDFQQVLLFGDDFTIGISQVPVDTDSDGIDDRIDNCTVVANSGQEDTDGDGHGNLCDGDFNNSCGPVDFIDLAAFKTAFFTESPLHDLNSDGGPVDFIDLSIFKGLFFQDPGPSACGVCPCP